MMELYYDKIKGVTSNLDRICFRVTLRWLLSTRVLKTFMNQTLILLKNFSGKVGDLIAQVRQSCESVVRQSVIETFNMTLKLVFAVIAPAFLAVGFDNSEPDCLTVHAVHRDIDFQPGQEASAGLARDLLGRSDVSGGLVVHLGSGDGVLTAALCAGESFLVHGLERDPTEVERSRAWLDSRGLHGQVLIDTWDGYRLPYLDNLVTLIIAEDADDVTEEEMLRVLAPQGTALLKRGVEWTKIVKPRTDAIDEWTHYLGGPDNNAVSDDLLVGPPRHIQWLAAPRWTRHHHTLNSISSVVTADRRLFYIADEASPANINLPSKWTIIARDAFNGVTLWKKPMESWLYHRHGFRSGPAQAPRMLVASANRLYTALTLSGPVSELDAVTGETVKTFNGTTGAEEIILADNTLLVMVGDPEAEHAFTHPTVQQRYGLPNKKSIVAVDRSTGNTLWRWNPAGHPVPETLASDGMNAFVRVGGGGCMP